MDKRYESFMKDLEAKFQEKFIKEFPNMQDRLPIVVGEEGRKYIHVKIRHGIKDANGTMVINARAGGSSHAFIEISTGALIKSNGQQPQRDKDGLATRWNISTDAGYQAALDAADEYGSYLYRR